MTERGPHRPRPANPHDTVTFCSDCGKRLERVPGNPKEWWHA